MEGRGVRERGEGAWWEGEDGGLTKDIQSQIMEV